MKAKLLLIVFSLCLASGTTASANTAKRIKAQPIKRKASVKRAMVASQSVAIPSYARSPLSQNQSAPLEDVQIRGLKAQIQKNSKELNQARWFLDEAYWDGVLPMSRELSEISGKIADKKMKRQKITKEELKEKAKTKRYLVAFKKWIKPTEIRAKKLEKENKGLSAALYQYILVAN